MSCLAQDRKAPFRFEVIECLSHTFQTAEHLERLMTKLMIPPLFTTIRIPNNSENREEAMTFLSEKLSEQCKELSWSPFTHFHHPAMKDCVIIKNRGPTELEKCVKEIIVDEHCGMAVLRGAHVYQRGIIGAPHGLKKGDHVSVYANVNGKCLKGTSSYSGDKILVGNGIAQISRSDLFNANATQTQRGVGILMTEPLYQAPSLADLDPVVSFAQNLPSMLCSYALEAQPGQVVLDLCAAPGGKTTHIATLMRNKGRVVALEKSAGRVSRMKEMLEKTNWSIIEVYAFDSTKAVDKDSVPEGGPPYPPAMFDRVLVDAPCSALGQRPCLMNDISLNQLKSFPVIQHKLLNVAVQLLKPGGVLVYSTCTLPVEENEDQVYKMLKNHPCLSLVQMPFPLGSQGLATSQLDDRDLSLVSRFDPSIGIDLDSDPPTNPWDTDTIGFFMAKFHKNECVS